MIYKIIYKSFMFIPLDLIYYIWLFDSRYILRNSKWYIINQLILTNYVSLINKPPIVPRLFDNSIFGYMVHFTNPEFKLIYTKMLVEDEPKHRVVFVKKTADNISWDIHFIT